MPSQPSSGTPLERVHPRVIEAESTPKSVLLNVLHAALDLGQIVSTVPNHTKSGIFVGVVMVQNSRLIDCGEIRAGFLDGPLGFGGRVHGGFQFANRSRQTFSLFHHVMLENHERHVDVP
jgi:hypothetical protein